MDKAPNAWGTKLIAVNPTGLPMDVTTITAGNTAVELLLLMGAVREDQDLAALPWGEEVEIKEECKQWCALYVCVLRMCLCGIFPLVLFMYLQTVVGFYFRGFFLWM